jgi:capsular exopolysaccharide synthesis family protein
MTVEDSSNQSLALNHPHEEGSMGAPQEGGLSFRYIVAAVRSNLTLIGFILLAVLAITVVVTLLQTPRFKAESAIQINNTSNRVLKEQDSDQSDESTSSTDTDRFLKTQVGVLQSNALALRVAQRLNLMTSQRFFASQGRKLPDSTMTEPERRALILKLIEKNLDIVLPHDSRIITISYESADPTVSADVANAFASEFIQLNLKRKFDSSSYARDFLIGQLEQTKQKLQESEKALNAYNRQTGIIRTSAGGGNDDKVTNSTSQSVTTASLLQLNQAANEAKGRRIAAEARWQSVNSGGLLSTTEVMSNAGVGQLLAQRSTIESALEDDRARHLADYPSVKSKEKALAAINAQITISATNIRNGIRSEYMAASQAERQLVQQVDEAKAATLNEQDDTVQYGLLAREVDTNRQVYDGLLQRYKELNAAAGITISNTSIIDVADAPLKPTSPNIWRNLATGIAAGLALAVISVAIKDQFDDSIRIPEDLETKLGLALLGVVPRVRNGDPAEMMADPKSSVSEAYNSLRGALIYSTPDGLPQTMLVTSAQASEGKSTTTYAIAVGFARMGKKVVLLDADLRRPTLHRSIDYDNVQGLSTLLTSSDSLASVLKPTAYPNLSIVPSGPVPSSPTELISGIRMREVLTEASNTHDVVLIDSPPVLGLADAPMMAAIVDGVIFVVEADRSRHGSLKAALRRLRAVRRNILGGVLTKFDPLRSANRYSSYYGYEYYQYSYKPEED